MVTFSVMFNLFLFSTVSILLLRYIFKDNKVILQLDTRFLLVCMLVIMCRLLVPVEFPLTNSIAFSGLYYPEFCRFLRNTVDITTPGGIRVRTVLEMIWLFGSLIAFVWLVKSYWGIRMEMKTYKEVKNAHVIGLMEKVNRQYRHPVAFRVLNMEGGSTPCVFGIFKPCIMIPDIEVTEKELEFIFTHEMKHFYRGDLWIKLFCEIFKVVYWFNPFAYLLCRLVAQTQEINVDFSIMRKLTEKETLDYSAFLIRLTRDREKRKKNRKWLMAFQTESSILISKRVKLMMDNLEISTKRTIASVMLSIAMVGLIAVCPNVIILEPYSIPEEDARESVGLREDKMFYLKNEDGTYSLYISGEYTTRIAERFDESIPLYFNLEEANKNE